MVVIFLKIHDLIVDQVDDDKLRKVFDKVICTLIKTNLFKINSVLQPYFLINLHSMPNTVYTIKKPSKPRISSRNTWD